VFTIAEKATTFLGRLSRKSSTSSVKNINSHAAENNQITGSSIFNNGSLIQDDKTSIFLYFFNGSFLFPF